MLEKDGSEDDERLITRKAVVAAEIRDFVNLRKPQKAPRKGRLQKPRNEVEFGWFPEGAVAHLPRSGHTETPQTLSFSNTESQNR